MVEIETTNETEVTEPTDTLETGEDAGDSHTDEGDGSAEAKEKEDNKRHNTRSRTPKRPATRGADKIENGNEPPPISPQPSPPTLTGPYTPVNVCAMMLADLDERSYHRAAVRDVREIMERIVLPISYPWEHAIVPVARNLAYDIDEMTEILTADDGAYSPSDNGPFEFGRYDIGQMRLGSSTARVCNAYDTICSAARRSYDPGTVQYSTLTLPPSESLRGARLTARGPSTPPNKREITPTLAEGKLSTWDQDNGQVYGEASLRSLQMNLQNKRRRVEKAKSMLHTKSVSIKVGSSSSRASIISRLKNKFGESEKILVMDASLPPEVHSGKALSVAKTIPIAEKLGTYDCRHGSNAQVPTGKGNFRMNAGRTRVIWSGKAKGETSQRASYRTLLTGEKLEAGAHKRPREVKVIVKVGGAFLTISADAETENAGVLSESMEVQGFEEDDTILHFKQPSSNHDPPRRVCILDQSAYVERIIDFAEEENSPYHSKKLESDKSDETTFCSRKPPILDSLPDNAGLVTVVCSIPGEIKFGVPLVEILGMNFSSTDPGCMVSQMSESATTGRIIKCNGCSISVRDKCYPVVEGETNARGHPEWRCASCSESNKGEIKPPPRQCTLCPYAGGPMSLVGNNQWAHEICKIWRPPALVQSSREVCALCGRASKNNDLIKCAAASCKVWFHPMCAFLNSILTAGKANKENTSSDQNLDTKSEDKKLSQQFTCTAVRYAAATGEHGKDPGTKRYGSLPVCFCGFHNPKRERSLFGLYPEGEILSPSMIRIPSNIGESIEVD